jgi:hypothetical protein
VHLLGGLQALVGLPVVALDLALEQGFCDRPAQLLGAVGLEQEVVGAAAQGADGGVDGFFGADHDHRFAAVVAEQPVHHRQAGGVGQAVVEDQQVVGAGVEA